MWTTEKPQKEGYYWVQSKGVLSGRDYIHPVRVYCSNKDGVVNTVFSDGENFSIDSDMFLQWYSKEIYQPMDYMRCPHCGKPVNIVLNDFCPECKGKL